MKNFVISDDTGKLFYVGGVVRDELLNRQSFDVDVVFEGDAIEHCSKYGEVVRTNPDFGTVRVVLKLILLQPEVKNTRKKDICLLLIKLDVL